MILYLQVLQDESFFGNVIHHEILNLIVNNRMLQNHTSSCARRKKMSKYPFKHKYSVFYCGCGQEAEF